MSLRERDFADGVSSGSAPTGSSLPTTTKGDLVVRDASLNTRLPVGTDTHVLTADSAEATGIKWAAAAAGGLSFLTSDPVSPSLGESWILNTAPIDPTAVTATIEDEVFTEVVAISLPTPTSANLDSLFPSRDTSQSLVINWAPGSPVSGDVDVNYPGTGPNPDNEIDIVYANDGDTPATFEIQPDMGSIVDADTVVITTDVGGSPTVYTFEFDNDMSVGMGNITVGVGASTSDSLQNLATEITNNIPVGDIISAYNGMSGNIDLTAGVNFPGTNGNTKLEVTSISSAGIVDNSGFFSGGLNGSGEATVQEVVDELNAYSQAAVSKNWASVGSGTTGPSIFETALGIETTSNANISNDETPEAMALRVQGNSKIFNTDLT